MSARVYIGKLGRVDSRDIEAEFGRFGRIERVDMKQGFCFVVSFFFVFFFCKNFHVDEKKT